MTWLIVKHQLNALAFNPRRASRKLFKVLFINEHDFIGHHSFENTSPKDLERNGI